jgi:N-acetylneuraminic acid mutarotase
MSVACSGCFGTNGIFYIHGLSNQQEPPTFYTDVYSYNPVSNAWTTLASHAPAMYQNEMVVLGNDIYSVGGSTEEPNVYFTNNDKLNTIMNTWSSAQPLYVARNDHQVTVMNNEIYVFGGYGYGGSLYDGIKYNPTTNLWINVTTTPELMILGRSVTYNNEIYINSQGKMWKFSSNEIERFAVERIY